MADDRRGDDRGAVGPGALLPRPNAEYAISQLPWPESSNEEGTRKAASRRQAGRGRSPKSSPVSVGQEGTRDKEATTGGGDHSPDAKPSENSQGGQGPQPGGQAEASGQQQARQARRARSVRKARRSKIVRRRLG